MIFPDARSQADRALGFRERISALGYALTGLGPIADVRYLARRGLNLHIASLPRCARSGLRPTPPKDFMRPLASAARPFHASPAASLKPDKKSSRC
jgi:hypothetical protein